MAHGLLVKNEDGDVLIDSDFPHYHFLGKYTHTSVTQVPDINEGGVANAAQGSNDYKGMQNMPARGEIYKFSVPVNGAKPPMCFIKPTSTGSSAPFTGIILTKQSGTNWEIWVFQSVVTSANPVLYCFAPLSQVSTSTSDTYGLKTFDNGVNLHVTVQDPDWWIDILNKVWHDKHRKRINVYATFEEVISRFVSSGVFKTHILYRD